MLQSQDNSRREIISSGDSPLRKQSQLLKRSSLMGQSMELVPIQSDNNLQAEKSIRLNTLIYGTNTAHEKSLKRLLCDSLIQGLGNFAVIYYVVLFALNFGNWNSLVCLYMVVQCGLHILIVCIDLMRNKWKIYKMFNQIDQQPILIYDGSTRQFKKCKWSDVSACNIIKLERGQACPADGIIIGTMGLQDSVNLIDQTGGQLFRKAPLTNIDLNNLEVEGHIFYDTKLVSLRSRLVLKLNSNESNVDITAQNKIKKQQINMSLSEIFVVINNKLKKEYNIYQKVQIDEKFKFTINIQQVIIIGLNILISIALAIAYKFKSVPKYLNDGIEQGFPSIMVEYLTILSWGIPIYQTINVYLMNRMSSLKTELDSMVDPDLSGKYAIINNSCALTTIAKARYILTDFNTLSRPIRQVTQLYLNKMSDEINLQNPFQIIPIQGIEDATAVQRDIQFCLLTIGFQEKSDDDIAIQKALLDHELIVGTNSNQRIIQDKELIHHNFTKLAEYVRASFQIYCYEELLVNQQKRHLYVYRCEFAHCKPFIDESIQQQLREQVEDLDHVLCIFKKVTSLQNLRKLIRTIDKKEDLNEETLLGLRAEMDPTVFIDIEDTHYDAHLELLDLHQSDYKIWINTHINNVQILEDDFTLNSVLKVACSEKISCPNAQELSERVDQIQLKCNTKGNQKNIKYYINDKPLLLFLDEISFSIGMKNNLINDKFKDFLYKVPFVILLNFKSSTLKLIDLDKTQIISATNYQSLHSSVSIKFTKVPCDVQVPHFSFVPKILIHHSKLSLIRIRLCILHGNYVSLLIGLMQTIYSGYNRFSTQGYFSEKTNLVITVLSLIYGFIFISFVQDFPFHIFAKHSNFEQITRVSFNPYKNVAIDFGMALFHAGCIVMFTLQIFYGTGDANGYVHGSQFHQLMAFIFFIIISSFKPMLELYRVTKLQMYTVVVEIIIAYIILINVDTDLSTVLDQGLKTKVTDLVSIIFVPICVLIPGLIYVYFQRVIRTNEMNISFYKMQSKQDEEGEMQKLKEAKNYVFRLPKKTQEQEDEEDDEAVESIGDKKQFS